MELIQHLNIFMDQISDGKIEIYNEFSLQHELGIYLREYLPHYKIQFERNAKYYKINDTIKHEIDITIVNSDQNEKYAIELKFPQNGQYPEEMYSFIKDIVFMEQLKENGFTQTYCLTVVQDKNFYSGKNRTGIYSYFRDNAIIHGIIQKPTGNKNDYISIAGNYHIQWKCSGDYMFYNVKV